jgi:hypothetical protein
MQASELMLVDESVVYIGSMEGTHVHNGHSLEGMSVSVPLLERCEDMGEDR